VFWLLENNVVWTFRNKKIHMQETLNTESGEDMYVLGNSFLCEKREVTIFG